MVCGVVIVLFITDIVAFSYFEKWFLYILFCYFIVGEFYPRENTQYIRIGTIFMLLLQSFMRDGRVGCGLYSMLPVIVCAPLVRDVFLSHQAVISTIVCCICLSIEIIGVQGFILGKNIEGYWFLWVVCSNLITLGFLIKATKYIGIRGNRSLFRQ